MKCADEQPSTTRLTILRLGVLLVVKYDCNPHLAQNISQDLMQRLTLLYWFQRRPLTPIVAMKRRSGRTKIALTVRSIRSDTAWSYGLPKNETLVAYKIQLRSWKTAEDLLKVGSIPKSDTKLLRRYTERTWF